MSLHLRYTALIMVILMLFTSMCLSKPFQRKGEFEESQLFCAHRCQTTLSTCVSRGVDVIGCVQTNFKCANKCAKNKDSTTTKSEHH